MQNKEKYMSSEISIQEADHVYKMFGILTICADGGIEMVRVGEENE